MFEDLNRRFEEAQRRLVTQASDFSLETIAAMVDSKALNPSPEYQRRQRWDSVRQSALIESFLLNVPVPPVYLAEEQFGVYNVIDGKQRITAIHAFMRDELELRGLVELPELVGMTVSQLPDFMANALRMRPYIRAVTLLKQSDPELKFEVFIRLNRGGESLNAQEVRHVAFRGPLNDLILHLAKNDFLLRQFNIDEKSQRYRQMQDAEYVLRFITLRNTWPSYSGDLAEAMDRYMWTHSSWREHPNLAELEEQFERAIYFCSHIWGEFAFRRFERWQWRGRALLGMYDAQMLAVSLLSNDILQEAISQRELVIERTARLFERPDFLKAVTVSTNTATRLKLRVELVKEVVEYP